MASDDHILGLRAQIKANATVLFPSAGTSNSGGAGPDDFEVIVTKSFSNGDIALYSACLVFGANGCNTVAASRPGGSVESALESLLDVLGEALTEAGRNKVSDLENVVEYEDGEIDGEMAILE